MSLYLVRTISNRRLVGLFFAESLPRLVVDVSKAASTEDCEFVELGAGAVFWKNPETELPLKDAEVRLPWDKSEMTGNWREALRDTRIEWIPLLTTEDVVR